MASKEATFPLEVSEIARQRHDFSTMIDDLMIKDPNIDHRILHENGVYSPQPLLSSLQGASVMMPMSRRPLAEPRRGPITTVLYQPAFSDSDGETGISEADRDARLA
jgi:hypothetical protein